MERTSPSAEDNVGSHIQDGGTGQGALGRHTIDLDGQASPGHWHAWVAKAGCDIPDAAGGVEDRATR